MPRVELNVRASKKALAAGLENLRASVKEGPPLPLAHKIKIEKTILAMGVAIAILKKVPCDQPTMTIDIPPRQERRSRRTKQAKRRKR